MKMVFTFIAVLAFMKAADCSAASHGVAIVPAPVLNTSDFFSVFGGKDGSSLKIDRCGQVRELEYIALPGTVFRILSELKLGATVIYQVETDEYQAAAGIRLYVDSRFIELHDKNQPVRKRSAPLQTEVIEALKHSVGSQYVWGGNVQNGIPEISQHFLRNLSSEKRNYPPLAGLDCSGLLYQATGGWTPRNTSQLISFGQPVKIKGRNAVEIARLLEPLDLIVWNGHLIIVLDKKTVIESRLECGKYGNGGVVTTSLQQRLTEIMRHRRPADNSSGSGKQRGVFVVRRWL